MKIPSHANFTTHRKNTYLVDACISAAPSNANIGNNTKFSFVSTCIMYVGRYLKYRQNLNHRTNPILILHSLRYIFFAPFRTIKMVIFTPVNLPTLKLDHAIYAHTLINHIYAYVHTRESIINTKIIQIVHTGVIKMKIYYARMWAFSC